MSQISLTLQISFSVEQQQFKMSFHSFFEPITEEIQHCGIYEGQQSRLDGAKKHGLWITGEPFNYTHHFPDFIDSNFTVHYRFKLNGQTENRHLKLHKQVLRKSSNISKTYYNQISHVMKLLYLIHSLMIVWNSKLMQVHWNGFLVTFINLTSSRKHSIVIAYYIVLF